MKHKLIMENWRRFVNESDDAGDEDLKAQGDDLSKLGVVRVVDFLNSPEGQDKKVRDALDGGADDGMPNDEVMEVQPATPSVLELNPTQNEISLMKSVGWPLASVRSVEKSITGDITGQGKKIVIAGNLVIDGHHRWSSTWATAGKKASINATNISLPGKSADQKLAGAQLAIAATMPPSTVNRRLPSASAKNKDDEGNPLPSDNILGADADSILRMILDLEGQSHESGGTILGQEYLESVKNSSVAQGLFGITPDMDNDAVKNRIAEQVAKNLSELPAPQGPERDYMPQFDGGDTHKKSDVSLDKVIDTMKSGKVNYKSNY